MKKLMQYHIISGPVIETRRSYLTVQTVRKTRGTRRAGASSAKKINLNEKQEALRLARLLNANFFEGGYLVSLTFSPDRLPESYEALCETGEKLMRKLRALCKKQGVELRRVLIPANWSPKEDRPARFHLHLVVNEIPLDLLTRLWPKEEIDIKGLRRGDMTNLAVYLYRNVKTEAAGGKHWRPSRNLAKPVYSEPQEVHSPEGIEAPAGAVDIYQEPTRDEDGRVVGSYLRCTLREPPRIRGGQIVLPRAPKRGGKRAAAAGGR